jgi:hypothetical protein
MAGGEQDGQPTGGQIRVKLTGHDEIAFPATKVVKRGSQCAAASQFQERYALLCRAACGPEEVVSVALCEPAVPLRDVG